MLLLQLTRSYCSYCTIHAAVHEFLQFHSSYIFWIYCSSCTSCSSYSSYSSTVSAVRTVPAWAKIKHNSCNSFRPCISEILKLSAVPIFPECFILPAYPTIIFLLCLHDSVTLCVPEFPAVAIVLQIQQFLEIIQFLQFPLFLQLQNFQLFLQILQILDPNSVPAAPPVPEVHSYWHCNSFGSKSFSVFYSTRTRSSYSILTGLQDFWGIFPVPSGWPIRVYSAKNRPIKWRRNLRFLVTVIFKMYACT